ncbi:pectinesterase family protein [Paenibacillus sp. TRM 82003]|nr:pectinesterase family protein [Paenibacillus sp. TRM 82003]
MHRKADIVVAADGTGDYRTVTEAVQSIPEGNADWITVAIRNGIYKEKLHIEKPFVRLIGEDALGTVLEYDDYALKTFPNGEPYHTFHSYSVFIGADDVMLERLTIANTAGPGEKVGQAIALYADGDRVRLKDCRLTGRQDTLFTGPLPDAPVERASFGGPRDGAARRPIRLYFERCYIEGDVDFIFGSATAVFDRCEIYAMRREGLEAESEVNGWLTAASTPADVTYGYVFVDCRLTGDAPERSVYLGRPWRNHAKTVFLRCWMGPHIRPEGWHNWNKPDSERLTCYAEYRSYGPGAAATQRVEWSRQLTEAQAEEYDIPRVLAGDDGWELSE